MYARLDASIAACTLFDLALVDCLRYAALFVKMLAKKGQLDAYIDFGDVRKRIPKGELHSRIRFTSASTAPFSS